MGARCWLEAFFSRTPEPVSGLTLGRTSTGHRPITFDDELMRTHLAISGRQGVGMSLLIEKMLRQQTEQGRGWFHLDSGCDDGLLARMAAYARHRGREDEFYVIDLQRPDQGNTYSLLHTGAPDELAARAVLTLPPARDNPGADFYRQQASYVLTVLFSAVQASGRVIGMRDLANLLQRFGDARVLDQLLDGIPAEHDVRKDLGLLLDNVGGDSGRLAQVCGGVGGRLFQLGSGRYSRVIDAAQPEVDFADILTNNKMCYVKLPTLEKDSVWQTLARMLTHDFFTAMEARAKMPRRLRTPFLSVLGDFGLYGHFRSTWPSRARALNVCIAPVISGGWEPLAKLSSDSFEADFIAGNTFSKVYFSQPNISDLEAAKAGPAEWDLTSLKPGEFIVCKGTTVLRGEHAPPYNFGEASVTRVEAGFNPGVPLPSVRARLKIEPIREDVSS